MMNLLSGKDLAIRLGLHGVKIINAGYALDDIIPCFLILYFAHLMKVIWGDNNVEILP